VRIRTVKPEYWPHRMHRRISEPAALLALALLNYADDEGRFEADNQEIHRVFFSRRPLSVPIETAMGELTNVGWIKIYRARVDGEMIDVGCVVNFKRHQRVDKPRASSLPAPPPDSLPPDSKNLPRPFQDDSEECEGNAPDQLPPKEGRKEGKDRKGKKEDTHTTSVGAPEPSLDEVLAFGRSEKFPDDCCQKFFHENKGRGTLRELEDWKSALRGWALSWGIWEKKSAPAVNGHAVLPTDDPSWWTQPLEQLENDAMGIGASADPENKKTAARMIEIAELRRQKR